MEEKQKKITSFTDLHAWREGHILAVSVYKLTETFPKDEQFGLTNQMRRCSMLITSNIAEGFSRLFNREKVQFYSMSLGSVTELQNQLLLSRDIGYLSDTKFQIAAQKTIIVHKLVHGHIKATKMQNLHRETL
jgi:four helix bundle protein